MERPALLLYFLLLPRLRLAHRPFPRNQAHDIRSFSFCQNTECNAD